VVEVVVVVVVVVVKLFDCELLCNLTDFGTFDG
jgi:hypothetical protein